MIILLKLLISVNIAKSYKSNPNERDWLNVLLSCCFKRQKATQSFLKKRSRLCRQYNEIASWMYPQGGIRWFVDSRKRPLDREVLSFFCRVFREYVALEYVKIQSILSYEEEKVKTFAREVSVSGRLQTWAKRFLIENEKNLRKLTRGSFIYKSYINYKINYKNSSLVLDLNSELI